jgi:hypothetical protein
VLFRSIEIEFDCSYSASLVIDGKPMRVEMRGALTWVEGLSDSEFKTIGGCVAERLYGAIADIMQAEAAAMEQNESGTWEATTDEALDAYDAAAREALSPEAVEA